jgi:hypothetical protein
VHYSRGEPHCVNWLAGWVSARASLEASEML